MHANARLSSMLMLRVMVATGIRTERKCTICGVATANVHYCIHTPQTSLALFHSKYCFVSVRMSVYVCCVCIVVVCLIWFRIENVHIARKRFKKTTQQICAIMNMQLHKRIDVSFLHTLYNWFPRMSIILYTYYNIEMLRHITVHNYKQTHSWDLEPQ